MVSALYALLGTRDHVVAQIVKTKFRVCAVGYISFVCRLFVGKLHAVLQKAYVHAKEMIEAAHLLAVALCQVVVYRNDVHAFSRNSVQVSCKCRDKGLTFTRFHLGNGPMMERNTTYNLHVKMTHAQNTPRRFAHSRKHLRQHIVETLAVFVTFLKNSSSTSKILIA